MSETDGLIAAFHVGDGGAATPLEWADLVRKAGDPGWNWIHLDQNFEEASDWLREKSGLSTNVVDALLAVETRPRCTPTSQGTLLILRGVNLNPDADPEDMIAVRVWIEDGRVVTVRRRKLMAVAEIRQTYASGLGPETPGDFVVALASGLVDRMAGVLQDFDEEVDTLEELQDAGDIREIRTRLISTRQKMIPLRRYLAPQRDALSQLIILKSNWLDDWQRSRLREITDRVTRFVEELDSSRERTSVIQDSITNRMAERMNEIMMVLSIVAAIFLPLGLLTGLLGINVGGIPGAENKLAFWIVSGLLVLLGIAELALFRRLKWI
jgi:zinc transporter